MGTKQDDAYLALKNKLLKEAKQDMKDAKTSRKKGQQEMKAQIKDFPDAIEDLNRETGSSSEETFSKGEEVVDLSYEDINTLNDDETVKRESDDLELVTESTHLEERLEHESVDNNKTLNGQDEKKPKKLPNPSTENTDKEKTGILERQEIETSEVDEEQPGKSTEPAVTYTNEDQTNQVEELSLGIYDLPDDGMDAPQSAKLLEVNTLEESIELTQSDNSIKDDVDLNETSLLAVAEQESDPNLHVSTVDEEKPGDPTDTIMDGDQTEAAPDILGELLSSGASENPEEDKAKLEALVKQESLNHSFFVDQEKQKGSNEVQTKNNTDLLEALAKQESDASLNQTNTNDDQTQRNLVTVVESKVFVPASEDHSEDKTKLEPFARQETLSNSSFVDKEEHKDKNKDQTEAPPLFLETPDKQDSGTSLDETTFDKEEPIEPTDTNVPTDSLKEPMQSEASANPDKDEQNDIDQTETGASFLEAPAEQEASENPGKDEIKLEALVEQETLSDSFLFDQEEQNDPNKEQTEMGEMFSRDEEVEVTSEVTHGEDDGNNIYVVHGMELKHEETVKAKVEQVGTTLEDDTQHGLTSAEGQTDAQESTPVLLEDNEDLEDVDIDADNILSKESKNQESMKGIKIFTFPMFMRVTWFGFYNKSSSFIW